MILLYWAIAFFACVIGKICGMGGGVIIKPVMDATGLLGLASINFYSACTVAAMTAWSVGRSLTGQGEKINVRSSTALAIGAAVGGVLGKTLFTLVAGLFTRDRIPGAVQSALLIAATALTMFYTLRRDAFRSRDTKSLAGCALIGLLLGAFGAFLGIGGGPFNMAVLYFFFSMDTKTAAVNSLYIILFSQITSILSTVFGGRLPPINGILLAGMAVSGILGSELGSRINTKLNEKKATRLFECAMLLVIGISAYNLYRYLG